MVEKMCLSIGKKESDKRHPITDRTSWSKYDRYSKVEFKDATSITFRGLWVIATFKTKALRI